MRIALVDSMPRNNRYPLSLIKLGSWQQEIGNECQIFSNELPQNTDFDEVWITTCFTYDIPHSLEFVDKAKFICDTVRVGGISATLMPDIFEEHGAIVHKGLVQEAEVIKQDFSLYQTDVDYRIVITGRGCPRKCRFCPTRTLEKSVTHYDNWENPITKNTKTLYIWDTNWTSKDRTLILEDINKLRKMTHLKNIDFSQGIDCRLIDIDLAKAMQGLRISPLRMAFDTMAVDGYNQRAIEIFAKHSGFKTFSNFVLYGFADTPQQLYYRLRENAMSTQRFDVLVMSYPSRYRPIDRIEPKNTFVGKDWTRQMLNNFSCISKKTGRNGYIWFHRNKKLTPVEQFEFWYGKDEKEFIDLLQYDRVKELTETKYGYSIYNF